MTFLYGTQKLLTQNISKTCTLLLVFALSTTLSALLNPVLAVETAPTQSATVMNINQVRGSECCDPGSLEFTLAQIEAFATADMPSHYTLRYDVLRNPDWMKALKAAQANSSQPVRFGVLWEVTPELAKAAGVEYQGSPEDWYQAHHAFLIGYTPAERTRLVDTMMAEFKSQLGEYPLFSGGWMIDTPSLNYLHQAYGLKLHQTTREQWGLDSYTLYGGPAHYPYPASSEWLFMPDYSRKNGPIIVRQTVTDPLYTYGDTSSAFTSQPNDYALDGKSHAYFEALLGQALTQPDQANWALIGLENTMAAVHQAEYKQQIQTLSRLCLEAKCTHFDIVRNLMPQIDRPLSLYGGKDIVNQTQNSSYWITSPQYRLRLRQSDQELYVDDYRIFNAAFEDPYRTYSAENQGYWVAPYLLDGSLWYERTTKLPWWKKALVPPALSQLTPRPQHDLETNQTRLSFPRVAGEMNWQQPANDTILLEYTTPEGQPIQVVFKPGEVTVSPASPSDFAYHSFNLEALPIKYQTTEKGFQLEWKRAGETAFSLELRCDTPQQAGICRLISTSQAEQLPAVRENDYPFLFPESKPRPLSETATMIYAHNPYAIAGRNPIRIVVIPYDNHEFPTTLAGPLTIAAVPSASLSTDLAKTANDHIQMIDLYQNTPQKSLVTVTLRHGEQTLTKTVSIYFTPHCPSQPTYCLQHPVQAWWWVNTYVRDKLRAWVAE